MPGKLDRAVKRLEKAEDLRIEAIYSQHCQGLQISVMKIPELFRMARAKLRNGESEESVGAAMATFVTAEKL